MLGGALVAETTRAHRVLETSHLPVYYVPLADVKGALELSRGPRTLCEWKGEASYYDVICGDGRRVERGAWIYHDPQPGFEEIRDAVALNPASMDECTVDGEIVVAQEGGFYGGAEGQRLLRRVRSRRTAWLVSRLGKLDPDELAPIEAAVEPLSRLSRGGARVRRTFSSLKYRNYRLFFAGQAVSQVGSWMQRFALGWFMLQLTDDPVAVGLLALATFLPFMLFGLFAGVITDRLDARKLVIVTQASQLVTASRADLDRVRRLRAGRGCSTRSRSPPALVLVLDVPSRQQLTYRMVGREALPNAIALNSSLFNASRILGPAAAGIVYGIGGAGICFLVNAISFLAVLLGLFAMRTRDFFVLEEFERPSILRGTLEGLAYVRRQPRMLILLGLTVVLSTFCFNFNVTLPLLADHTLHASAVVYGVLSAVFGAGALVGALTAAALGRASTKVMLIGSLVFTASELALAPVHGRDPRRRAPLLRRRRLRRLVGELEHLDAARRARPAARPDHRHLLLRVQRHRPDRRRAHRLADREGRNRARVPHRRRPRPRSDGGRRAAAARTAAAPGAPPPAPAGSPYRVESGRARGCIRSAGRDAPTSAARHDRIRADDLSSARGSGRRATRRRTSWISSGTGRMRRRSCAPIARRRTRHVHARGSCSASAQASGSS